MIGKTGIIVKLADAQKILTDWKLKYDEPYKFVILEMTISNDLRNAKFFKKQTVIGNEILSIKEI